MRWWIKWKYCTVFFGRRRSFPCHARGEKERRPASFRVINSSNLSSPHFLLSWKEEALRCIERNFILSVLNPKVPDVTSKCSECRKKHHWLHSTKQSVPLFLRPPSWNPTAKAKCFQKRKRTRRKRERERGQKELFHEWRKGENPGSGKKGGGYENVSPENRLFPRQE